MIWKVFRYLIRAILKFILIAIVVFLFISFTNVGGSMDAIKEKYYSATGNSLHPDSILSDLQGDVDDSMEQLDNVSTLFNKSTTIQ